MTRPLLLAGVLALTCSVALFAQREPGGQIVDGAQSAAAVSFDLVAGADFLGTDAVPDFIVSPSFGSTPTRLFDGATGNVLGAAFPFGSGFIGGVRVAAGDLTGDGIADLVLGMGPGGGLVTLLNGNNVAPLGGGYPFGPAFGGGVSVAVADFNGDGRNDIVAGQASGGGYVSVFNGLNYAPLLSVAPFGAGYTGGVNVAAGDVTGDGRADLLVGQASGGTVALVDGATGAVVAMAAPYGNVNGAYVALGDVTGDGRAEAMLAPGSGNGPVIVFDVRTGRVVTTFVPYPASSTGGVRIAATDVTGDGLAEILTVPGPGPAPALHIFDGATFARIRSYPALPADFTGGALVAAPAAAGLRFTTPTTATVLVGVAANVPVRASGSPRVTTISITGALPAGLTFTDNGNGEAQLSGTPDAGTAGIYPLTFTATNGVRTETQNVTLAVNQAPAITSAASTTFVIGVAGTFSVTSTGAPATTVALTGTLPAGVTFTPGSNGTATLAGTPATGTTGAYPLTFTASNGVGTAASQSFTLTIQDGVAFTSAAATSFTANVAGSFSITTAAIPTVTSIGRTGVLPAGVNFTDNGNGTATLAGTAPVGAEGTYPLQLTATNGVDTPAQQSFTLTVVSCGAPVTVLPAPGALTAGTIGTPYSQIISATGGSGHTFVISSGAVPGLTLSSGGALTGTPTTTGTFNFTVLATASGGCSATAAYSVTIAANAQNDTFNGGVGNTQMSVGAGAQSTPAVVISGNVLTNDAGSGSLTAGPASIATTGAGLVAMASSGTFVYTPAVGFAGPTDTFTYTLTDGNGGSDTATVTLNMSGVVWYVNGAGAAGDGRSHSPFNTMPAAATAAQANQVIYVHAGSPAGATVLKASQTLQGAGEAFTLNGLTIAAGAAPTLSATVTLANGVAVRALSIAAAGAPAIAATGLTGAEVLAGVAITSGSVGFDLSGLAGTLTATGGSIAGVSGPAVRIDGGTGTITIGSTITSATGHAVDVQNRTAGAVTFTGAITDTNSGILLNANTGSSIAFSGGLSLSTGANDAFTATGGGTVTATQDNVTVVNTITTTAGTALRVVNTEIGGAGLTFRSIAAGTASFSAGNGIVLDTTGVGVGNGGLTVTGNGTGTLFSGGIVRRKSGADSSLTSGIGAYLNATKNPSFRYMQFFSFENAGIVGRNVSGFLLEDSEIDTAGTTLIPGEGPLVFGEPSPSAVNGLIGTGVIRNTNIIGGIQHNAVFHSHSGAMDLTFVNTTGVPNVASQVSFNQPATGEHGLVLRIDGTATATATLQAYRIRGNRLAGVHATAADTSSLHLTVDSSEFVYTNPQGGTDGLVLENSGSASLTATVNANNFSGMTGAGIRLGQASGNATAASLLQATVTANTFDASGNSIAAALSSTPGQVAPTRLLLSGIEARQNTLVPAVVIDAVDPGTTPRVDVTLLGSHIDMVGLPDPPNPDPVWGSIGVHLRSGVAGATMCANVLTNTSHPFPPELGLNGGIVVEQLNGGVFLLERGAESIVTAPDVVLESNNVGGSGPSDGTALGTITVVENATCLLPTQ